MPQSTPAVAKTGSNTWFEDTGRRTRYTKQAMTTSRMIRSTAWDDTGSYGPIDQVKWVGTLQDRAAL